jgi:amidase
MPADLDALLDLPAREQARRIRARDVSAVELREAQLDRIERRNPPLNAIVTLDADGALEAARAADAELARLGPDRVGPLHGLAMTLKDSHATAGMRTSNGAPGRGDSIPDRDGTVAARVRAAGAIILGKTNVATMLGDFQTDNELFGRSSNPWDLRRTPGGSSGGAAAAVATGLTPLEVGSDLGGSIRVPAAFCGIVGFKPTEDRIPHTGHMALPGPRGVRIMGAIGPLARDVEDVRHLFELLAGPDGEDPAIAPVPYRSVAPPPIRGLRVAVATGVPGTPVAAEVAGAVGRVAADLAAAGAVVDAALPPIDWPALAAVRRRLITASLEVFDPDAEGGPYLLADHLVDLDARDDLIRTWTRFFEAWDVLLMPVVNRTAFEHRPTGEPYDIDGTPTSYWTVSHHTRPFNLIGSPAISLPAGLGEGGVPLAVQLAGPRWGDERLLAIAAAVEPLAGGFVPPPHPSPGG